MILRRPQQAFVSDLSIARQWRDLGYRGRPDFGRAVDEYDALVALFDDFGIDLVFLPHDDAVGLDSLYPRDAAVATDEGLVLCRMGKDARRAEPAAIRRATESMEIPVRDAIVGNGTLEGGDVVWIDRRTLAVGRSYRTNDEGIRQLREILGDAIDELFVVSLPHHRGPEDVFHLMSVLSPIDEDLALVYSPLLPIPFREWLLAHGLDLIEVPESEFGSMGCNVLTVARRRCVMLEGNPLTRERLEDAGAEVFAFPGEEICHKGCGGPTCLTRPLQRD